MRSKNPDQNSKETLYLIDISSFIFRAFYAVRALHTSKGEPVNAVFGVATMLAKCAEQGEPQYLAAVFDSKEPSFRKTIYSEYKANRSAPPEDLVPQFDRIEELVRSLAIPAFRKSGIEADDLIATLTERWLEVDSNHEVVIVTGDKDLMQLVSEKVTVWDTMKEKLFSIADVQEKFGVPPERVRDYLALVGDASDNIPGVMGFGPKSATLVLTEWRTLEGVLAAAKAGKITGKKGDALKTHESDARLSMDLVTLKHDVEIDFDPTRLSFSFSLTPEAETFLKEMEFRSLAERWGERWGGKSTQPASGMTVEIGDATEFRMIHREGDLFRSLEAIERVGEFSIDLETTSLNPRQARIVGISLCYDRAFGSYIPLTHRGASIEQLPAAFVIDQLRGLLANPKLKKIGQNLKYDWSVLHCQGIQMDGIGADTMVASYILDPVGKHGFDFLCAKYLGYDTLKFEDVCGKGKDQILFDEVSVELATRYSAEDALYTLRLWDHLRPLIEKERLTPILATVDLPLVTILGRMECDGISLDTQWLRTLASEFKTELIEIEQRIQSFTHSPVNLNSPKQLAKLLFEDLGLPTQSKTKTGYSTDASVLDALASLHEVPKLLLGYREISKLLGTYVEPLPGLVDPKTNRVHASFHQTVTATGRLSGSEPNLQNIPVRSERGQKIRRAFVPTPGNAFVSADYSQIELRILAHMSGDKNLCESFLKGEDVHRRTASEIFSKSSDSITDRERNVAKAINFGLMYGKTVFGLSQELKIPRGEAKDIIDRYFKRYAGVKAFLDRQVEEARECGYVHTLLGRKRELSDIRSNNPAIRANAERMAMNTPIQGTAADLMKLAMIALDDELSSRGRSAQLLIQVHDEVVLECPESEIEETLAFTKSALEGAMKLKVPLVANVSSGANWMEL